MFESERQEAIFFDLRWRLKRVPLVFGEANLRRTIGVPFVLLGRVKLHYYRFP